MRINNNIDYFLHREYSHAKKTKKRLFNKIDTDVSPGVNLTEKMLHIETNNIINDSQMTKTLYHKFLLCNVLIIFITFAILITSFINYEMNFANICSTQAKTNIWDRLYANDENSVFYLISTLSNSLLTILLLVNIFIKYSLLNRINVITRHLASSDTLISSGDYIKIFIEMLIALPHPIIIFADRCIDYNIHVDSYSYIIRYEVNELLYAMQFLRIYFILSSSVYFAKFSSPSSFRITSFLSIDNSMFYMIKCVYNGNRFMFLFVIYSFTILFCGMLIYILERPVLNTFRNVHLETNQYIITRYFQGVSRANVLDYIWYVFTGSVTLGIGEINVVTFIGKAMMIFANLIGVLCVTLLIATIIKVITLDDDECRILSLIQRMKMRMMFNKANENAMQEAIYIAYLKQLYNSLKKQIEKLNAKGKDRLSFATSLTGKSNAKENYGDISEMYNIEMIKIYSKINETKEKVNDYIKKRNFAKIILDNNAKEFSKEEYLRQSAKSLKREIAKSCDSFASNIGECEIGIIRENHIVNEIGKIIYNSFTK